MTELSIIDTGRRFGGLDRLYGPDSVARLRHGHVAVAGIGGVGSWCVEALARCGVGRLTLIDLDHVAESNLNRQAHALESTLGQAKISAMANRIRDINSACDVVEVDDFVEPENVDRVIPTGADFVIDCTDQAPAKIAMILQSRRRQQALLVCGGAGGKTNPLALRSGDLSQAVNDALLAKLRNTLRRQHGFPKASDAAGKPRKRVPRMHVRSLWFDQPAILPTSWTAPSVVCDVTGPAEAPQGLSCAGYGSVMMVTATMGLAAADEAVHWLLQGRLQEPRC
jgi:Dinucleotide-utilizing enzymes involved in molybdopterin and thiamine biosynthesis family 1